MEKEKRSYIKSPQAKKEIWWWRITHLLGLVWVLFVWWSWFFWAGRLG